MASPAAVLNILITANTAQATTALAKTQTQLKATTATATTAAATMKSRLATGAKYGSLALAGLGAASVKMSVDFDKSMRNVNSIAQLNEKQLQKLEDQVKSLAGKTAQSPQTLAEGLYDLVSSGFDAKESMVVLAASAKAATAGLTDTATSTKAVAAVLNAYRLPAKKAADVSDTLFQTVNLGVVSFEELSSTIGDVLPFASSLNVKLNEVGAAVSTMTKAGISPAETMTRLKAAMSALIKPSEGMTAALKQLGYESGEALIKQEGFQGALETLAKAAGGSKEELAKMFPNIRALGAALALTGKNTRGAEKDLAAFADTSGATNKALSQQSKSVAYQWNKLKAQASALAIDIGDNLIPALKDFLDILTDPKLTLSQKVQKLGTELTKTIEEWAPKAAAAGAVIGGAIIKGMWNAFWDSDLLGKLFIAGTFIRLLGGPGVFGKLGAAIGTRLGGAIAARLGPGIMAALGPAGIFAGVAGAGIYGLMIPNDFDDRVRETVDKVVAQFEKMRNKVTPHLFRIGAAAVQMGAGVRITKNDFNTAANGAENFADALKDTAREMRDFAQVVDKQMDKVGDATKDTGKVIKDFASGSSDSFGKTSDKSNTMADKVGANILGLANTVTKGLGVIVTNTNKALQGFGVKKVAITLKNVGDAAKGFQTGGVIVPGQGDGDKVPAMLEPGEVVWNKKAVAAMGGAAKANRVNSMVPRFAKGGTVGGATGGLHPAILKFVSALYQKYGGTVSSGLRAGDSGSLHSTGQAADYVPSNWAGAAGAANRAGGSLLEGIYNPQVHGGPAVSWDSGSRVSSGFWGGSTWAGHMDHIHLAVADGTKVAMGAAMEDIKRVILKGPDGPLKSMGQAALDKVRDAANRYIASKMPPIGTGGGHAPVKGLPDALQKYNQVYPVSSGFGDGYAMPFNAVAALAEWAGAPGVSMARTAIGESQLEPGAIGYDPGGTRGLGLWMITTGFNDALIKKLGGESKMRNPVINAQAMNSIFDSQGIGAWYSQTADSSNTHYNGPLLRQLGGIIPGFAKGTKGGKGLQGGISGGSTDTAWKRFDKARKLAKRLKDVLGDKGRVAKIDERIQMAETLAGLDSSEAGSDLGPTERAQQIRLNEQLLSKLVMARKLARTGLHWLDFPKGMSTTGLKKSQLKNLSGTFNTALTDLTGVTGKGGRIFDTKIQLDTLKNTTTGSATPLDISGLRAVIEAARYGAFDGFFAKGGSVGAGKWGIAGERGPEIVRGPATVQPTSMAAPTVNVENNFDWQGMDLYVETKVNGVVAKRERIEHRKARQYA